MYIIIYETAPEVLLVTDTLIGGDKEIELAFRQA